MTLLPALRQSVRRHMRTPAVSLGVVVILACAVGANTLVFSLVNGVLLRPLAFRDPDQLVSIRRLLEGGLRVTIPYADYETWRVRTGVFDDVAGISSALHDVVFGTAPPRAVWAGWVTPNFFTLLGPRIVLGRAFAAGDHRPGHIQTAIVTEAFWRSYLAADPRVVGSRIAVTGGFFPELAGDYVIVGVVAVSVRSDRPGRLTDYEILFPCASPPPPAFASPTGLSAFSPLIGRLKPGISLAKASAAVARLARELGDPRVAQSRGTEMAVFTPRVVLGGEVTPLHERELGWTREGFLILGIGVALVLLTACVNVGGLLLATGLRRTYELAVRSVLGAGRRRLVCEMLAEHVLLGSVGGAAGVVLAAAGIPIVLALVPSNVPRVDQVCIDTSVLAFTAFTAGASVLLFGLVPAVVLSKRSVAWDVRGRPGTVSKRGRRVRQVLVGVQIALTTALLIGTLLSVRSLWKLATVPLGFEPQGVAAVELVIDRYARSESGGRPLHDRLLREMRTLQDVTAAALTLQLPAGGESRVGIRIPGIESNSKSGHTFVHRKLIAGDYFDVFRIPLRQGRVLGGWDRDTGAAVVNESFARRYFPSTRAVGQRIFVAGWREVVGVVADAREQSATVPAEPTFYQALTPSVARIWIAVRSPRPMALLEPALRRTIDRIDPELPARITTLNAELATVRAPTRFYAAILTIFAVFALVLAGAGVYTLSYFMVAERTHEFGVRLALGAQPLIIGRSVLLQTVGIALPSVVLGGLMGIGGSRVLRSVLYGLSVTDPVTLLMAGSVLVMLALFASVGPARRAALVDPAVTLRWE